MMVRRPLIDFTRRGFSLMGQVIEPEGVEPEVNLGRRSQ
jgi:hypothetical protein